MKKRSPEKSKTSSPSENKQQLPDKTEETAEEENNNQQSFLNLPKLNQKYSNKITIQVNGQPIYENEIIREIRRKLESYQLEHSQKTTATERQALYKKFRDEAENTLISKLLIMQQAQKENIIPHPKTACKNNK